MADESKSTIRGGEGGNYKAYELGQPFHRLEAIILMPFARTALLAQAGWLRAVVTWRGKTAVTIPKFCAA